MSAIVFPANPDIDDTYVVGDTTWRWDGVSWRSNNTFNGRMPAGRSDQRPEDPKIGMIRYNTDLETFEGYTADGWIFLEQEPELSKGDPPDTLGQAYRGGFYIGTICAAGQCYALIVAPNANGCACCQWRTARTATAGTDSTTDGFSNTYGPLDNADHPAGNWTATRTINGFSDWYLPATDELNQLYVNDGGTTNTALPAGEGFAAVVYWSSNEGNANCALGQGLSSGSQFFSLKTNNNNFRAVRRDPI